MNEHQRRSLRFTTLDEVAADARDLLARGYTPTGAWNLAQVCGHVNDWMRYPMDGYPVPPLIVRPVLWTLKRTVGKRMIRNLLAGDSMKPGSPTMRQTIPAPDLDPEDAVEALCQTIGRMKSHQGPWHASPLFGTMDRDTCIQLNLIHAAHHLSFLAPKSS